MIEWKRVVSRTLPPGEVLATNGRTIRYGTLSLWGNDVAVEFVFKDRTLALYGITHYADVNFPNEEQLQ